MADTTKKKPTKAAVREKASAAKSKAATASSKASAVAHGHGEGFIDFLRTQGVVGLAVGLAIGTAAGNTVKAIVNGFINPIVQFIIGSHAGLESAVWHVKIGGRTADFAWGAAVSSLITLVATALVIYWIVNVFRLGKLDKPKE